MWETLYQAAIQKITSTTLVALLTSLTIATSGVAGYKLMQTTQQAVPSEAAVRLRTAPTGDDSPSPLEEQTNPIPTSNQNDMGGETGGTTTLPTVPSTLPAASALPKATTSPATQANTGSATCIITVSGKTFDVQPLLTSHPGGNVFVCDTDMTSAYQKAHGSSLTKLMPFATTAQLGQSSTNSTSGNSTAGSSIKNDDDDEDKDEDENRFSDEEEEVEEEEGEDED